MEEYRRRNPGKSITENIKKEYSFERQQQVIAQGLPHETRMNGLEKSYAQFLDLQKHQKKIIEWKFEPFNIRLASPRCYYRIDFLVMNTLQQIELHETKGKWVDGDALVKFKVAAESYPFFIWKWVTKSEDKFITRLLQNGSWSIVES